MKFECDFSHEITREKRLFTPSDDTRENAARVRENSCPMQSRDVRHSTVLASQATLSMLEQMTKFYTG